MAEMSSRLDRITLSLSSPTFLAFSSPSFAREGCLSACVYLLPSFNCRVRARAVATSVLPVRVNVPPPFPSRCKKDLILKRVACAVLLAFPSE